MKKWTWIGAFALLIGAGYLGMYDISLYSGGVAGGAVPTPDINSIAQQPISWDNRGGRNL
jgi:hypothetical protein